MSNRQKRLRAWVFTLNNPTDDEVVQLKDTETYDVSYLCFQRERGHDEKTEHLQGMVYFKQKQTMSMVKRYIQRAHWEGMKGTFDQAHSYVTKLDTRVEGTEPEELGTPPRTGQGKRSDVESLIEDIVEKKEYDELELCKKYKGTYLQRYKAVEKLIRLTKRKNPEPYTRTEPPQLWVIFGPAGVGKSWWCEEFAIKAGYSMCDTVKMDQMKKGWYDGYCGEDGILSWQRNCVYTVLPSVQVRMIVLIFFLH